jgi:hypothetical protein
LDAPLPSAPAGLRPRAIALILGGLLAVLWSQFAWVRPTNFSGYDEWLYISLTSRGIISFPQANRPLVLFWHLPAVLVRPHSLGSYFVMYALYLTLAGWTVFALCRRLSPEYPLLAFLTAAFSLVWAPLDASRLNTVGLIGYAGFTFSTFLAMTLFVEARYRRSPGLLALAGLIALFSARGTEAVVPLLLGAPVLLRWLPAGRSGGWRWTAAWEAFVALAAALVLRPVLFPSDRGLYQAALGLDPDPRHVAARLLQQFNFHLEPLVGVSPRELAVRAVPIAIGVFGLAFAVAARHDRACPGGREARPHLLRLMLLGLLLAGLGYAAFALSGSFVTPLRTQFLSAPGIALFLAAGLCLLAGFLPPRARRAAIAIGAAWVVAVGTARMLAMQRDWDAWGYFPAQRRLLTELTMLAPDFEPRTLVVLIDEAKAFPATFTLHHAVEYLYEHRASGYVWGASDFLYPARFGPDAIHSEPWPVIRKAWDSPAMAYRYDEAVVVRFARTGGLSLLEKWPDDVLPPLPAGARYDPRARIRRGGPLPPSRAILRSGH